MSKIIDNIFYGKIEQFASAVINFSSQYGTLGTSSYTASNLASDLRVYPKYGDYTEAFVLRTYGPWWDQCPSARSRFRCQRGSSQDFVELEFNECVIPTSIQIYETYHPGAVVKILACNADHKDKVAKKSGEVEWVTLWTGSTQCDKIPKQARVFSPALKKIEFATNLIRLEFNSKDCEYYTELDAVKLIGIKPKIMKASRDRSEGFQVSLTTKLIKQLSLTDRQSSVGSDDEDYERWGYFGILPDEIIQRIFHYLDEVSLARVAQTCSLLLKNSYDPLLYHELNLQQHWNTIDDVALASITPRCSNLQHLNLSWTGGGGQITEAAFCNFIKWCGQELITLELACCQYVQDSAITEICDVCSKLEVLDLSCSRMGEKSLMKVSQLTQLKYLNLYSVNISPVILQAISNLNCLEHLNIGACGTLSAYPEGMALSSALEDCLKRLTKLISLDLWRCKFVSLEILDILGEYCPDLEELDIGWCRLIHGNPWDPAKFLSKCSKLKKLFLTCGRNVSDFHLQEIAKHCRGLEQLDVLGTNQVSLAGVSEVCKQCKNLSFFDVSFCGQISVDVIEQLTQLYPNVCFKRSFN